MAFQSLILSGQQIKKLVQEINRLHLEIEAAPRLETTEEFLFSQEFFKDSFHKASDMRQWPSQHITENIPGGELKTSTCVNIIAQRGALPVCAEPQTPGVLHNYTLMYSTRRSFLSFVHARHHLFSNTNKKRH